MALRSQQKAQDLLEKTEHLQQELDGPLIHSLTEDCLGDRARKKVVSLTDEPNFSTQDEARTPPSIDPQHRVSAQNDLPLLAGQEVETKLRSESISSEEHSGQLSNQTQS